MAAAAPQGELVFGPDGALYGTTYGGGLSNCTGIDSPTCGIVYKLTPAPEPNPWGFEVIYKFKGGDNGYYPGAKVVFDDDGTIYSTTAGYCGRGGSTVFKLTPPGPGDTKWKHRVLRIATLPIAAPKARGRIGRRRYCLTVLDYRARKDIGPGLPSPLLAKM
jgi:hypothetical protein